MNLFASLVLLLVVSSGGDTEKVSVRLPGGIETIRYHSDVATKERVQQWIQFSPHVVGFNSFEIPEHLELCIENSPDYKPCDTRTVNAPHFVENAELNLNKIRSRIKWLETTDLPVELSPVVSYILKIQKLSLDLGVRRLKFYQTGNLSVLASPIDGLRPAVECKHSIELVTRAVNQPKERDAALRKWGNCVNTLGRFRIGRYPGRAWEKMLSRYKLSEEYVENDDN